MPPFWTPFFQSRTDPIWYPVHDMAVLTRGSVFTSEKLRVFSTFMTDGMSKSKSPDGLFSSSFR